MEEDLDLAENILKLTIELQNFCESTPSEDLNKNILSIKFKILFLIHEYENISPSTLVKELMIAKSNIALFCKQLIDEGYIISNHDEFDHRIIYYCLTSKGKEYVKSFLSLLNKHIGLNFDEKKQNIIMNHAKVINNNLAKIGAKTKC